MVSRLLIDFSPFSSALANFSSTTRTNSLISTVSNHNNDQSNRTAKPGFFIFLDKQIVTKLKVIHFCGEVKKMSSIDSKSKLNFFLKLETEKYLKVLNNTFYFARAYLGRHFCHLTN